MISAATFQKQLDRRLKKVGIRIGLGDDLPGLVLHYMRGCRPYDTLVRDGMISEQIHDVACTAGIDSESDRIQMIFWLSELNFSPKVFSYVLTRAIKCLTKVEGLGNEINSKIELLREERDNPVLKKIFQLTLDWRLSFGFAGAFEVDLDMDGGSSGGRHWQKFIDLLMKCNTLPAVNNKIRERMRGILEKMPKDVRKWAYRVLMRDLRIRIGVTTARKVWPQMFPMYAVQLCQTIKKDAPLEAFVRGDTLPEEFSVGPKLDGFRMEIWVTRSKEGNERGVVRSRSGLEQPQLAFLVPQAAAIIQDAGLRSGILDGEATDITGKSWAEAAKAIKKNDPDHARASMRFWAFDIIPIATFLRREGKTAWGDRWKKLFNPLLFPATQAAAPNIQLVPMSTTTVRKPATVRRWLLAEYQKYRDAGYEGAIIYDQNAPYHAGDNESDRRKSGLYRIKPFEFIDVMIVDSYEGNGMYKGMLGGFLCKTEDGVFIRVGGGFKEHQRKEFWADREGLKGRVMEVERQEDTPGIKSRHTNFKRLRPADDKSSELFE